MLALEITDKNVGGTGITDKNVGATSLSPTGMSVARTAESVALESPARMPVPPSL